MKPDAPPARTAGASDPVEATAGRSHLSPSASNPPSVPDHELLRLIGKGSYGEVWLARSLLGTWRAVKIVRRTAFEDDTPFRREFHGIEKFEPVSRTHDGLVGILQVGANEAEGYFYCVMELADGEEMQNEKCKVQNEKLRAPAAAGEQPILNFEFHILNYRPRTLRSDIKRRGPLPPGECITISLALARALAHLHRHGLVHRDIKPSNIIFIGGTPRLADIGLVTDLDATHTYVGTEGFMAPEGPGTPQADIYSLGKVLYEMATGKDRHEFPDLPTELRAAAHPPSAHPLPSEGRGQGEGCAAENPQLADPALSGADRNALLELNEIFTKACANDPRQRYQTAEEMAADLERLQRGHSIKRSRVAKRRWIVAKNLALVSAAIVTLIAAGWLLSSRFSAPPLQRFTGSASPAPAGLSSLAVLPFDNDSPDPADAIWASQFTEELNSALTRIPGLRVLGHRSARALKQATNLPTTASPLGLTAVVDGRVRKVGDRLRVSARVIDARSGFQLWADVYERDLSEVFGLQSLLGESVVKALGIRLTGTLQDRLSAKPTGNLAAYQAYLDGLQAIARFTLDDTRAALERFEAAIRLDPKFVPAYAELANAHLTLSVFSGVPSAVCYSNAQAVAHAGLALDNTCRGLHAVLGRMKTDFEWNWAEAQHEYKLAGNHTFYSRLLAALGRHEEAIAEGRKSIELDPLSVDAWRNLGSLYHFARRYPEAEAQLRRAIQMDSNYVQNYLELGFVCERTDRFDEAVQAWAKWKALRGRPSDNVQQSLAAYAAGGRDGYLRGELARVLEYRKQGQARAFPIARLYAMLGEKEPALEWLETAYAERDNDLPWVNGYEMFDFLRTEPRFIALLKQMGLGTAALTATAFSAKDSVAVLPFVNENTNWSPHQYLCDALTDATMNALTDCAELLVAPRAAVFAFRRATNDFQQIGERLNVRTVLAGSMNRQASTNLHLTARLISVADGAELWSASYDRHSTNMGAVQREVAKAVAQALGCQLSDEVCGRLESNITHKLAAYKLYSQGITNWGNTQDGLDRSIQLLNRAIAEDQNYAQAYAALAYRYQDASAFYLPQAQAMTAAKMNALRALELDDALSAAHLALAMVFWRHELDFTKAEARFQRAIELAPNDGGAYGDYAAALSHFGLVNKAEQVLKRGEQVDPTAHNLVAGCFWPYYLRRDFQKARQAAARFQTVHPNSIMGSWCLALATEGMRQYDDALAFAEKSQQMDHAPDTIALTGRLHARLGHRAEALKALEELRVLSRSPRGARTFSAEILLGLGETNGALEQLKRAVDDYPPTVLWLRAHPIWDDLRSEPRFIALLQEARLQK